MPSSILALFTRAPAAPALPEGAKAQEKTTDADNDAFAAIMRRKPQDAERGKRNFSPASSRAENNNVADSKSIAGSNTQGYAPRSDDQSSASVTADNSGAFDEPSHDEHGTQSSEASQNNASLNEVDESVADVNADASGEVVDVVDVAEDAVEQAEAAAFFAPVNYWAQPQPVSAVSDAAGTVAPEAKAIALEKSDTANITTPSIDTPGTSLKNQDLAGSAFLNSLKAASDTALGSDVLPVAPAQNLLSEPNGALDALLVAEGVTLTNTSAATAPHLQSSLPAADTDALANMRTKVIVSGQAAAPSISNGVLDVSTAPNTKLQPTVNTASTETQIAAGVIPSDAANQAADAMATLASVAPVGMPNSVSTSVVASAADSIVPQVATEVNAAGEAVVTASAQVAISKNATLDVNTSATSTTAADEEMLANSSDAQAVGHPLPSTLRRLAKHANANRQEANSAQASAKAPAQPVEIPVVKPIATAAVTAAKLESSVAELGSITNVGGVGDALASGNQSANDIAARAGAPTSMRFEDMPQTSAAKDATPSQQVLAHVTTQVRKQNTQFTVQLTPDDLGNVDVVLDFHRSGKVHVSIQATTQEALDSLQRDSRLLERSLNDLGLKADSSSLSFSLKQDGQGNAFAGQFQGEGGNGQPSAGGRTSLANNTASQLSAATETKTYRVVSDSGLDIQV